MQQLENREVTFWKHLDDRLHVLLESDLQDAVRLVDNQHLQVPEHKARCILQQIELSQEFKLIKYLKMIEQAARCAHQ
jgi:hypothetical protein